MIVLKPRPEPPAAPRVRVVYVLTENLRTGNRRRWSLDELREAHPYLFV